MYVSLFLHSIAIALGQRRGIPRAQAERGGLRRAIRS